MNKRQRIEIAIVAVVGLAVAIWAGNKYAEEHYVYHTEEHILVSAINEQNMAPDFVVFDNEGEETHLYKNLGKKVVVSFWATWCGPAKGMVADFDELYEDEAYDVEYMMVNLTDGIEETLEKAKKYIKRKDFTIPMYFDLSYSATHAYEVETLPLTVFIDETGHITDIHQGTITKSQMHKYLNK